MNDARGRHRRDGRDGRDADALSDDDIDEQYALLDILDAKSAGLLAFNTIFLTAISVWLGYVPLNAMHLVLDLVFLLLASCALLLGVIRLRWARPGDSAAGLHAVRDRRSRLYGVAWTVSAVSIGVVIVVSAVHAVGTALQATKRCGPTCTWFYGEDVFGNLDVRK